MKAGSLALLLVSKLAEVGVRNYSRNFESESVTYQSFNQTCLCECHCSPPTSLIFTLITGLLLGFLLGVWLSWALERLSHQRVHGSSSSPRRRGGGIVIVPPRPAGHCVVLWWQCVPWEIACVESEWLQLVHPNSGQWHVRWRLVLQRGWWSHLFQDQGRRF